MSATPYIWLGTAIVAEITGIAFLARSEQFSRLIPTALVIVFYGFASYALAQALKGLPLGIAYAIWAGLGVVLATVLGVVAFKKNGSSGNYRRRFYRDRSDRDERVFKDSFALKAGFKCGKCPVSAPCRFCPSFLIYQGVSMTNLSRMTYEVSTNESRNRDRL